MPKAGNTFKKFLLIGVGLLSLMLGIIGIWVPGLPTTVFILIAIWAFSQSSQRLHQMLYRVPLLQKAVAEAELFAKYRQVHRRSKIISQSCAWLMVGVTILLTDSYWMWGLMLGAAISCSLFMWRVKTAGEENAVTSTSDE